MWGTTATTGRCDNWEGISPYSVRQWSVLCMTNAKYLVRKRQFDRLLMIKSFCLLGVITEGSLEDNSFRTCPARPPFLFFVTIIKSAQNSIQYSPIPRMINCLFLFSSWIYLKHSLDIKQTSYVFLIHNPSLIIFDK